MESKIAENVKNIIDAQVDKGLNKYGQTLDMNDDTIINRLVHFQEEMADGLQYAEWIKNSLMDLKTSLNKVRSASEKQGYLKALDDLDNLTRNNTITHTNQLRLIMIDDELTKIEKK